jgi:hypothetical protein
MAQNCMLSRQSASAPVQSPNLWHAAQALAASYTVKQQWHQPKAMAGTGIQNIVFHTRSVAVRQFANQAELLDRCLQWAQEAWGGMRPANCSTHIFTDVPSSIAGELGGLRWVGKQPAGLVIFRGDSFLLPCSRSGRYHLRGHPWCQRAQCFLHAPLQRSHRSDAPRLGTQSEHTQGPANHASHCHAT